jgi:hypothetical protein
MPGPKNKGAINLDSYDGTAPSLPAAPTKQINPNDAKVGGPKPGVKAGAGINFDTYFE